ncbi:MAG: type II secretion system protein [Sedimentisphaerales bacterium]|nr:type II secretion system protein [Sedimentisphaerales bacterium]
MIIRKKRHSGGSKYGFTLAEAMIAMVILGMAAAGVLLPFSSGASVQAEGMRNTLAAKLASDLLEQVINEQMINTPFSEIIASYNYSESQGQVKDSGDNVFTDPAYLNFSRTVSCEYVDVLISPGVFSSDTIYILVTVQVDYSGRTIATMKRLIYE